LERRRGYTVASSFSDTTRAARSAHLSALDRVFLRRACELAQRGRGSTSPNPAVGAVFARGATTLGEGFHHVRGEPHAEVEALRDAASRGNDVRDATLYVSLEPCNHTGLTPPCSQAVLNSGVTRVVVGARDPNPKANGGVERLREADVTVVVADDGWAQAIVEDFVFAVTAPERPFVRLKLAVSLDGYVASRPGVAQWLTGEESRAFVRDLRASYDAVLVGAGTVRIDDPQLSVRPPRARRKPYVRAIACEDAPVPLDRKIFASLEGYAPTIVLAPAGRRDRFAELESTADVVYVAPASGESTTETLDLADALAALRARGIASVLCEGGPTLAGRLIARGLVDRIDWLVAPVLLGGPGAIPALGHSALSASLHFDGVEQLGPDIHISGSFRKGASCSAD
jgi:diaminohydroxyphosphoribosylaminopyrimidine deaminase / 5-amino-6-(5-phosphoribosylamino)uracil reductase